MKSQNSKDSQNVNLLDLLVYLASKWKWFLLSVALCCSMPARRSPISAL